MKTTRILQSIKSKKELSVEEAISLYKEKPSAIYSKEFFKKRHSKDNKWKLKIGEMLSRIYNLESLVDFGCGEGEYLQGALKYGVRKVLGFEYLFDNVKKYLPTEILEHVKYGNVMESIDCGKFDCAMSIEVAEHILPEKSEAFVDNLVNASKKYILLTAAPCGQGGIGHINERPREFWIEQFIKRDFIYLADEVSKIHVEIREEGIQIPDYFSNLLVFIKEGE